MEVEKKQSPDKKYWQSKKCIAFTLLLIVGCAVILSAVYTRQATEVIREAIGTFGLAIGAGAAALIGGQSVIDSVTVKKK